MTIDGIFLLIASIKSCSLQVQINFPFDLTFDLSVSLQNCATSATLNSSQTCQCRYLVSKLEEVAPKEMRHEEKLAFWINVHNTLVMHVRFL